MIELKTGIYQHYKGPKYLVLGVAHHSETGEILACYIPLYEHDGAPMAVRPIDMFLEDVGVVDPEHGHVTQVPRFRYLGNGV